MRTRVIYVEATGEEAKVQTMVDQLNTSAADGTTWAMWVDTVDGADVYGIGYFYKGPGDAFAKPYAPLFYFATADELADSMTKEAPNRLTD